MKNEMGRIWGDSFGMRNFQVNHVNLWEGDGYSITIVVVLFVATVDESLAQPHCKW